MPEELTKAEQEKIERMLDDMEINRAAKIGMAVPPGWATRCATTHSKMSVEHAAKAARRADEN